MIKPDPNEFPLLIIKVDLTDDSMKFSLDEGAETAEMEILLKMFFELNKYESSLLTSLTNSG